MSDAAYGPYGPSLDTVSRRFPSVGRFIQVTRDLNSAMVAYHMEHPLPEEFLAEHLRLTALLAPPKKAGEQ